MHRINVSITDPHYKKICAAARVLDLKPGTFAKFAALSAANCQIMPDVDLSYVPRMRNVKQLKLDLFHTEKK